MLLCSQELVEEVNKTHINAQEAKNKVLQENQVSCFRIVKENINILLN